MIIDPVTLQFPFHKSRHTTHRRQISISHNIAGMALKLILLAALAVASDASSILREAKDNVKKQMAEILFGSKSFISLESSTVSSMLSGFPLPLRSRSDGRAKP